MNSVQRSFWRAYASVYDIIWDSPLTALTAGSALKVAGLQICETETPEADRSHAPELATDLGCGTGLVASTLRACGYRVTGVDASAPMLARARSYGRLDASRYADAAATGLPSNSADMVVVSNVLHLDATPTRILTESLRLAKPGATIVCMWPTEGLDLGTLFRQDVAFGRSVPRALLAAALRFCVGIPGALVGARSWPGRAVAEQTEAWARDNNLAEVGRGTACGISDYAVYRVEEAA